MKLSKPADMDEEPIEKESESSEGDEIAVVDPISGEEVPPEGALRSLLEQFYTEIENTEARIDELEETVERQRETIKAQQETIEAVSRCLGELYMGATAVGQEVGLETGWNYADVSIGEDGMGTVELAGIDDA